MTMTLPLDSTIACTQQLLNGVFKKHHDHDTHLFEGLGDLSS